MRKYREYIKKPPFCSPNCHGDSNLGQEVTNLPNLLIHITLKGSLPTTIGRDAICQVVQVVPLWSWCLIEMKHKYLT